MEEAGAREKKQEKKKADSSSIAAFLFRIDKEG